MRVIIADCAVEYVGRGNTSLDRGLRAFIWKQDGSISVHSDSSNKPLNYMDGKKVVHTVSQHPEFGCPVWVFESRHESITVIMHHIISDSTYALSEVESGLQRDGTEKHLQEWLSEHIHELDGDLKFIEREHRTGAGSVDLLCERVSNGALVAVEVKRVALLGVVYQTLRYVDSLNRRQGDEESWFKDTPVEGLIAAVDIRPTARALAEKKNLSILEIPHDWNSRGYGGK